jgi:hypothetical protein
MKKIIPSPGHCNQYLRPARKSRAAQTGLMEALRIAPAKQSLFFGGVKRQTIVSATRILFKEQHAWSLRTYNGRAVQGRLYLFFSEQPGFVVVVFT